MVAVVLPVNAAVVVALQYAVGRRLSARNIRPLMTFGTLCYVLGLGGFILSGNNLLMWGISAAIFTLGEIIYAPGEYMLIDQIAPPGMKASYFFRPVVRLVRRGVQSDANRDNPHPSAALVAILHFNAGDSRRPADDFSAA